MAPWRIVHNVLGALPWSVIAIAVALPATAAPVEGEAADVRAVIAARAPTIVKSASAATASPTLTKSAPASLGAASIVANACSTGCAREPPSGPRPLIASLPAGESFEIRILKDARQGFRLRASNGNGPASPDERVRIQLSRRYFGIGWSSRF